ncbi:hypothetical protein NE237_032806 [Protea cynaroides]|uniref:Secreted protein n=1 Tax=Protea cynaroides TaxID=273540 RepID=A0A9Q0L500_9MAGN|nr:hypothetical protein NE237_032806 [Protea cynaroides]
MCIVFLNFFLHAFLLCITIMVKASARGSTCSFDINRELLLLLLDATCQAWTTTPLEEDNANDIFKNLHKFVNDTILQDSKNQTKTKTKQSKEKSDDKHGLPSLSRYFGSNGRNHRFPYTVIVRS